MSAYEQEPGQGSLFKNDRKEKDTHPDYKGDARCPCCEEKLWADMWTKRPEGKKPYFSLNLKKKEAKNQAQQSAKPAAAPAQAEHSGDFEDDIPF